MSEIDSEREQVVKDLNDFRALTRINGVYTKITIKEIYTLISVAAQLARDGRKIKELTEENERLRDIVYRLECDLQLNADEKAVAKAIEQTKKATVRKMQKLLYQDFNTTTKPDMYIKSIIDKRAKEMLNTSSENSDAE